MPAKTARCPPIRFGVIGSPTSGLASRAAAIGLTVIVLANARRRRPLQRHHPQNERQGAAACAEVDAGEPLRCGEACQYRGAVAEDADGDERCGADALPQRRSSP